jgi:hypothetical protein
LRKLMGRTTGIKQEVHHALANRTLRRQHGCMVSENQRKCQGGRGEMGVMHSRKKPEESSLITSDHTGWFIDSLSPSAVPCVRRALWGVIRS